MEFGWYGYFVWFLSLELKFEIFFQSDEEFYIMIMSCVSVFFSISLYIMIMSIIYGIILKLSMKTEYLFSTSWKFKLWSRDHSVTLNFYRSSATVGPRQDIFFISQTNLSKLQRSQNASSTCHYTILQTYRSSILHVHHSENCRVELPDRSTHYSYRRITGVFTYNNTNKSYNLHIFTIWFNYQKSWMYT